jgi:hypothetical protein
MTTSFYDFDLATKIISLDLILRHQIASAIMGYLSLKPIAVVYMFKLAISVS